VENTDRLDIKRLTIEEPFASGLRFRETDGLLPQFDQFQKGKFYSTDGTSSLKINAAYVAACLRIVAGPNVKFDLDPKMKAFILERIKTAEETSNTDRFLSMAANFKFLYPDEMDQITINEDWLEISPSGGEEDITDFVDTAFNALIVAPDKIFNDPNLPKY